MRLLIVIALTFAATFASAQATNLTELALFHRCYSQITSLRANANDQLTKDVASGKTAAVDACMSVLNSARLTGSSSLQVSDSSNATQTGVLATFNRLHASWFFNTDFPTVSWPGHDSDMKDLYDSTTPAFYFTRALLGTGFQASDPVTTHDFLRAIRTTMAPSVGPESGHPTSDFIFSDSFAFASTGTLIGFQTATGQTLHYPASPGVQWAAGTVSLYTNIGGGFLGTAPYLLLNLSPLTSTTRPYKTDGGVKLHRRYGKAVYKDTLCRDLPVVRESDATFFVDTQSTIPFRTSPACAECHVSHDRVSGVVRGLYVNYVGQGDPSAVGTKIRGGNFPQLQSVTMAAEGAWPTTPDASFSQRPTNGTLYFRDYQGHLVDENVTSLDDLGQKIATTDDYYICLAKRYYQYFLGISVNTGDLGDPAHPMTLVGPAATHRTNVVNLGLALKENQDLSQLVKSILSLPAYRKSDFGVN